MEWPASSPDVNSIENIGSVLKMKLFEVTKQYDSKENLLKTFKTAMS